LPLPPLTVKAYFNLNTSGYRWPLVGTGSTLGSRCRCGPLDGAGQFLDELVDCVLVFYHGLQTYICEVSFGPLTYVIFDDQ
jgi:hypothetical protein